MELIIKKYGREDGINMPRREMKQTDPSAQTIIAVSGVKNSGKTALLEQLIPILRGRGLRCAVIKHDGHRFAPDREGTDTQRLLRAGAMGAAVFDGEKAQAVKYAAVDETALAALYPEADVIFLEGLKSSAYPKIEVWRTENAPAPVCDPGTLLALVTDAQSGPPGVPRFGLDESEALAELLLCFVHQGGCKMGELTHFNENGRARMVDVSEKPETARTAVAAGRVRMAPETLALVKSGGMKKGDVLGTAQIAGIMAAKRTAELIPMCHPLALSGIDLDFRLDEASSAVEITATVRCTGATGVEMEALTAVSTAALTVYDMCKAVQKDMSITDIRLLRKSGGKSGAFIRGEN